MHCWRGLLFHCSFIWYTNGDKCLVLDDSENCVKWMSFLKCSCHCQIYWWALCRWMTLKPVQGIWPVFIFPQNGIDSEEIWPYHAHYQYSNRKMTINHTNVWKNLTNIRLHQIWNLTQIFVVSRRLFLTFHYHKINHVHSVFLRIFQESKQCILPK